MGLPVKGASPPGAGQETLPRGSLAISGPREQLVTRSIPGAYTADGVLAPDTLRIPIEKIVQQNVVADGLAVEDIVAVYEEDVVWGGSVLGKYGHFLVEAVARLWPLLPGAELEGLPVVFATLRDRPFVTEWIEAFGARTVELPDQGTVRFERMHVPEPAWRVSGWVAPEIRDIHLHARRGMEVPRFPRQDILWLSQSRLGPEGAAYDEALLEWLLGDLVTPVHLETMPLAEQVGMLESCRAIAGLASSAFYTMLLTSDAPDCLYLSSPAEVSRYVTQHRVLDAQGTFEVAAVKTMEMRRARQRARMYPGGHRILIPDALQAFDSSVLPNLLEDPRLAAFGRIDIEPSETVKRAAGGKLDSAALRVVRNPLDFPSRMVLAEFFEERGLPRCAREQYMMVADLSDDPHEAAAAQARQAALGLRCES
jgi:hypothetical protein